MAYLIYNSVEEAKARSEEAGREKGLSFHRNGQGSRYWWGWLIEAKEEDPRVAIEIQSSTFTDEVTGEEVTTYADGDLITEEEKLN